MWINASYVCKKLNEVTEKDEEHIEKLFEHTPEEAELSSQLCLAVYV